jgi:3-isopropylmalate/(R)-2-methylmalate dehydratase large subunit
METKARTFAEKALARAAGRELVSAGDLVEACPDRILTHDNTAAIARIFYEKLGRVRVADPEQLCITLDHAAPPPTPKHAENHAETRRFVSQQGVRHFFEVGRGVCHQVLSEEALVLPGQLILGADSHTTHFGWLGAFGAGVGRSEAAVLWAAGRLWLRVPESIRFTLTGELGQGVTAKDLSLYIIGQLGADGGLYASVEFDGPGLDALSLESRMVIPNMMAEFGVKNAYLPPDEKVFTYLAERFAERGMAAVQASSPDSRPTEVIQAQRDLALYPDHGARYIAEYSLDLSRLEPLIACPHSVDRVKPLTEVAGQRVDMAFIGTCTNGRLEDLAAAAEVLRGRRVHTGTRLLVIPASSEVYRQALWAGYLEIFIQAGAAIGTPGCGPCMGNHLGIPAAGEVVISSANRNFRGRMGQPEAEIYLASPAVVAASALLGRIASQSEVGTPSPISGPSLPHQGRGKGEENSLFLNNDEKAETTLRSITNNGQVEQTPLPPGGGEWRQRASLGGEGDSFGKVWKYGDNVNTDQIFPGKYTYTLATPDEIAAHALEDLDASFSTGVQPGDVIFGGRNFGCGSSREQAVTCLKHNSVAALVAESFGRIFYRNAINQGLPAVVCPEAVAAARPGDPVQIDLTQGAIRLPAGVFSFPAFPPNIQAILDAGGLIPYIQQNG